MKLTNLLQPVDKLQQVSKIDNLQQVGGVFDCVLETNFKTKIGTLQRTFRTYKQTFEEIFQKQIEIESKELCFRNFGEPRRPRPMSLNKDGALKKCNPSVIFVNVSHVQIVPFVASLPTSCSPTECPKL